MSSCCEESVGLRTDHIGLHMSDHTVFGEAWPARYGVGLLNSRDDIIGFSGYSPRPLGVLVMIIIIILNRSDIIRHDSLSQ